MPAKRAAETAARRTRLFRPDVAATFLSRPNRYLVRARVGKRIVDAYCPNPGRLAELLLPGAGLVLERPRGPGERRTRYTLAACRHRRTGLMVPLYAVRSNSLVGDLVLPALFPDALEVRAEARLGASRIDFVVLRPGGVRAFVEVKTCTLIEHGVAMFPDAPSTRGLRHLEELAAASASAGVEGHTVFVLMSPKTERMVPNVHTDPAFAFGLLRLSDRIGLHAVSVRTGPAGWARVERNDIGVDLEPIRRLESAGYSAGCVGGAYLLVLTLGRAQALGVGGLGRVLLPRGGYVYVGSAMRAMGARVARHLRARKRLRWHIDYLTGVVDSSEAFPIVSARRLECELAREIRRIADAEVAGFGCSDCDCASHLFRFPEDPRRLPAFLELLLRFRHVAAIE